ncbi:sugar phosphate isomerase/epimerase family protein [Paenibacillus nasutitermitis]|uniref:Xylose isomerase n=1 Tax=Paenibacillus nasutitermitis TaxID=1652958 RepID=A0A916ZBX7_9BACL|nr:sugar phosphate isomerase/epimerase [Paenibacillus nasutitermitis]GGD87002.1 xylose isomerase [Paenibacillus nasutitermitis]
MNLGVFTEYVAADTIEELAFKIAGLNLNSVVLSSYPGLDIDFENPSPAVCKRIANAFSQAGVVITAVSGYSNLLHPDDRQRSAIHRQFSGLIRLCQQTGVPMLCTETGTFHPQSEWEWDPSNSTEQAMALLVDTLKPFAQEARDQGIELALEPYVMNVAYSPARAVELMERIGQSNVKLIADPVGMLTRVTLNEQELVLADMFRRIAPYIGLVHAEDCRPDPQGHFSWLGAGEGAIDYPLFMDLLVGCGYEGPVILEHLKEDRIASSRNYVLAQWTEALRRSKKEQ